MDTFRSFKHKNFKLFFYGQSISLLGNWIQKTAVIWLVYRLTGSSLFLGIVSFVSLIPTLILSPYAGSYIDRHNRFKIINVLQRIAMVQAGTLAAIVYFKVNNVWLIILLTLIQGMSDAFEVTCRQSLMVEMVDDKADLPNAIALNSTMTNLARIVGPAIAGILLSTFGEDFCFISNFVSYIPVLICLGLMRLSIQATPKFEQNIWNGLKEGLNYITSDKEIIGLIGLLAASSLMVIPFTTLVPIFAKEIYHGNAGTFSLFESAIGAGSVISAVFMAQLKGPGRLVQITIVSSLVFGSGVLLVAVSQNLLITLLGMVLSGAGMIAQISSINTYIQMHVPPEMRGRAVSYFVMSYLGVIPIGSLIIGVVTEYLEVRKVVAAEGILALIAVAVYMIYRRRQQLYKADNNLIKTV
ncbi:MFS transporter [Pedobacter sp. UBA5917]|uniref:MFS transporter n=1 Tax=Pedobacter sp. UBA5917 TaxID=1947061 RepID=UPI0025F7ED6B|nr:MFS transporter [Pedobacter sp. UBA5917]